MLDANKLGITSANSIVSLMVLEGELMKYITSVVVGSFFTIILTFVLTPLVNDSYISITNLAPGPDGESKLLDLLVFVQWPIYFSVGSIVGWFLHKKYLTNKVRLCEERTTI